MKKKNKYLYAVIDSNKDITYIPVHRIIDGKHYMLYPLSIFSSRKVADETLKLSRKNYKLLDKDSRDTMSNPNKAKIIKIKY